MNIVNEINFVVFLNEEH